MSWLRYPANLVESPISVLVSVAVALFCHRLLAVLKAKRAFGATPVSVTLLWPNGILANYMLPRIPGVTSGSNHHHENGFRRFNEYGLSAYGIIGVLPDISTGLVVADAAAIKEITTSRARFPKDVKMYGSLEFFGRNIVIAEWDEWKKYRRVSAPAFSDKNNKLVWEETSSVVQDLFKRWDADGEPSIVVDHALDITLPLALFVIGSAGFGQAMSWKDTDKRPEGHFLTFKEALSQVAHGIFVKVGVPGWAMGATETTRAVRLAFDELDRYMREMIQARMQDDDMASRNDLFSSLLLSNVMDGDGTLTERELMGNIFVFLVAGHETTAHSLCFALALLALHQDEQGRLYEHLKSLNTDGSFTFQDMPKLTRSLAVLYETMRLFTPVTNIPKVAASDTTLTVTDGKGEQVIVPVPQGTSLVLNGAALHKNPRYWSNPEEFNPDRFLGEYNKDAFIPFSAGVRSCLGKKFAETEAVAALSMIVNRYKVTIKEEPEFTHESFEQRKRRVLQSRAGITVTPIRVPLVFTKRD
ncbi:614/534 cytochrome P450 [Coprinopsis sp. MPI-PUGE-AT-0042]|nr:614/534 cytochrome P450 [Coprinopsis sp. MPI-PUGE-AT-0042]